MPRDTAIASPVSAPDAPARRVAWLAEPLHVRVWRNKLAALAFLAFALSASFYYEATPINGFVICPLRRFTGLECAGCGMTRSWCAIADGHLDLAVALNPFGPVFMALAAAKLVTLVPEVIARRRLVIPLWERVRVAVLGSVAVAMIAFGIYRAVLFFAG